MMEKKRTDSTETDEFEEFGSGCKPKPRIVHSSELFSQCNEVLIHHEGAVYRLRITKNGKLIMNK